MKKFLSLIIILVLGLAILTGCTEISNTQNVETKPANTCNHEWVITSEYSWWAESYRTVSKCSKCGQVVR